MTKTKGTVSRISSKGSGFQVDNIAHWYNRSRDFKGTEINTLSVGSEVEFDVTGKAQSANGAVSFVTNVSIIGEVSASTNGRTSTPSIQIPQVNEQMQRSVVLYSIVRPAVDKLLSFAKTQKEAIKTLQEISILVESYLIDGQAKLSDLLATFQGTNGNSKKQ